MKRIRFRFLAPFLGIISFILFASFLFMLGWNYFLVPAVGTVSLNYWQSMLGLWFIVFVVNAVIIIKGLIEALSVRLEFHLVKKKLDKELAAQEELLKHFKTWEKNDSRGQ